MVKRLKVVGLAPLAALVVVGMLGRGAALAAGENPQTVVGVLDNGSVQMEAALSDLGKGDLEGASVSSGKAFETLLQATKSETEGVVVTGGVALDNHGGDHAGCSAAEGKGCFAGLKRYVKGAAVGGAVGATIGTVSGSVVGYLGAKQVVDFILYLASAYGIPESMLGSATTGLLYGTAFGGALGAIMGAAGGAVTGAAILGYSPIRNAIVKAGRFIRNLGSSVGDGK